MSLNQKVVLQHSDSRTVISSLDDDYNIDDDELDDIKNMPIVHGVYYDPWARKLKCDKELFKVKINVLFVYLSFEFEFLY